MHLIGRFPAIFWQAEAFCGLIPMCQTPLEKGTTLKGKNLLPEEQILSF